MAGRALRGRPFGQADLSARRGGGADGQVTKLERYDTTYVPSPIRHLFRDVGDTPLRILWVYSWPQPDRPALKLTGAPTAYARSRPWAGIRRRSRHGRLRTEQDPHMSYLPEPSGWTFTDDRGQVVAALRRPARVVAYIQAGAALADLGVRPIGVFGSAHDRVDAPDPVKAGPLADAGVAYYGAGEGLDLDALLADRPDLVVGVSHAAGQAYGIPVQATKHLEEQVPLAVLDVGQAHPLAQVRDRFGDLARALGAPDSPAA
ncbi:hypothetical protein P8605_33285, partial [Streptomyces sp. T-3]|nr:hypothetical protein [Streptomyces sp. T-3]